MSTSFTITTELPYITVNGGMSAEIVFGKYVASAQYNIYKEWNNQIVNVDTNPNIIIDTLQMISNIVTIVESSRVNPCSNVLISPGFLSAPYLVELMNLIYLPSHILVGVNSMIHLEVALSRAHEAGIDCYAVIGFDSVVPTCLVAWIKFRSIPPVYQKLISNLKIRNVIAMGVWEVNGVSSGECVNRAYGPNKNVFFTYVQESYGNSTDDTVVFSNFLGHETVSHILQPRVRNLGDWESSIDYLTDFFLPIDGMIIPSEESVEEYAHHPFSKMSQTNNKTLPSFSVKCHCFYADNTVKLYCLATELASLFMKRNNISQKGVVLNPYIICNPLYEVTYGYLPIVYWQFNNDNQQIYKKYLDFSKETWVNLVYESSYCNMLPAGSSPTMLLTEKQIGSWIKNFRQLTKPSVQYLNMVDLKILSNGLNIRYEC